MTAKYDARGIRDDDSSECPNCLKNNGCKLTRDALLHLLGIFFVDGSNWKTDYGSAPAIQFNEYHYGKGTIDFPEPFMSDMRPNMTAHQRLWLRMEGLNSA
jgi:hypothetical protein